MYVTPILAWDNCPGFIFLDPERPLDLVQIQLIQTRLQLTPQASPTIYIKLLLTAFFWGGTWIAGRVAVQEASPLAVASWRFFVATLVLGALFIHREGRPQWSFQDWLKLSLLGLTGVFLYNR